MNFLFFWGSSKYKRNGSRAKLTWRSSGVVYFARDLLRSYFGHHLLCTGSIAFILRWTSEKWNSFLIFTYLLVLPSTYICKLKKIAPFAKNMVSVRGGGADLEKKKYPIVLTIISSNRVFAHFIVLQEECQVINCLCIFLFFSNRVCLSRPWKSKFCFRIWNKQLTPDFTTLKCLCQADEVPVFLNIIDVMTDIRH